MQLSDILYVLFRHKRMISVISVAAIIAAVSIYRFSPVLVQSNAKLYIKYVMDNREPTVAGDANGKMRRRKGLHRWHDLVVELQEVEGARVVGIAFPCAAQRLDAGLVVAEAQQGGGQR